MAALPWVVALLLALSHALLEAWYCTEVTALPPQLQNPAQQVLPQHQPLLLLLLLALLQRRPHLQQLLQLAQLQLLQPRQRRLADQGHLHRSLLVAEHLLVKVLARPGL